LQKRLRRPQLIGLPGQILEKALELGFNIDNILFIKHFGQRIDIDYLDTEEVVKFFLQASDQYDKKIIQDRLDRYNDIKR